MLSGTLSSSRSLGPPSGQLLAFAFPHAHVETNFLTMLELFVYSGGDYGGFPN
jgi:hypothetical protein